MTSQNPNNYFQGQPYQGQPYQGQPYQQQQPYQGQPYQQQPYQQQPYQQQPYQQQPYQQQPYQEQPYQQQPYQQQSYPPQYGYQVPVEHSAYSTSKNEMKIPLAGGVSNNSERFKEKNKYQDILWAIAFVLQLIAIIGLSAYYYTKNHSHVLKEPSSTGFVNKHIWGLIAVIFIVGLACAGTWTYFIKRFSHCLIWFSLYLNLGIWVAMALVSFLIGSYVWGFICLLIAALTGLWMWCVRDRIHFASAMISISIRALLKMPTNFLLLPISAIIQVIWSLIWIAGLAFAIYDGQSPSSSNTGSISSGLLFLFVLSFYWTSQVIANVVLVAIMGSVATWYFKYPDEKPPNPVWSSFKRASTTSFGSVCMGSFMVAFLQAIRFMIHQASNYDHPIARACADCILRCLQDLINYFNMYAYAQVAIYGKSYCEAAKDTWNLFITKGFDAIINDDLVQSVLWLTSNVSGAITAVVAVVSAKFLFKVAQWEAWVAVGFAVGFVLTLCVTIVVAAAVKVIFVCFAEDPAVLNEKKPEIYSELELAWNRRYGKLPSRLVNPN